jgi:hypothetical protein
VASHVKSQVLVLQVGLPLLGAVQASQSFPQFKGSVFSAQVLVAVQKWALLAHWISHL